MRYVSAYLLAVLGGNANPKVRFGKVVLFKYKTRISRLTTSKTFSAPSESTLMPKLPNLLSPDFKERLLRSSSLRDPQDSSP